MWVRVQISTSISLLLSCAFADTLTEGSPLPVTEERAIVAIVGRTNVTKPSLTPNMGPQCCEERTHQRGLIRDFWLVLSLVVVATAMGFGGITMPLRLVREESGQAKLEVQLQVLQARNFILI